MEAVWGGDVVEDLPEAFDGFDFVDFTEVLGVVFKGGAGGWGFVDMGGGRVNGNLRQIFLAQKKKICPSVINPPK